MLKTIIILIMCHLVGDYILQSNFIATTKDENLYHLFVHCVLYILPFIIYFGFTWQAIVVFISHFIIDISKCRYHWINYFQDQLLHYIVLGIYFI